MHARTYTQTHTHTLAPTVPPTHVPGGSYAALDLMSRWVGHLPLHTDRPGYRAAVGLQETAASIPCGPLHPLHHLGGSDASGSDGGRTAGSAHAGSTRADSSGGSSVGGGERATGTKPFGSIMLLALGSLLGAAALILGAHVRDRCRWHAGSAARAHVYIEGLRASSSLEASLLGGAGGVSRPVEESEVDDPSSAVYYEQQDATTARSGPGRAIS